MSNHDLVSVLEQSKSQGFLGPGPVADHIDHAMRFARALAAYSKREPGWLPTDRPVRLADLGAGGGLPSLPLLVSPGVGDGAHLEDVVFARSPAVLIDGSDKRCRFLEWAGRELGLSDRTEVWCARAEELGHEPRARFQFDLVLARSFGPPASTVECGAPLLVEGGLLAVSEPPGGRDWPTDGLARVGLVAVSEPGESIALFRRDGAIDDALPRRIKIQRRQPLFELKG